MMHEVERWAEELGYSRVAGALLRGTDQCPTDHPFASEIKSILEPADELPPAAAVFCIDSVPTVCLVDQASLATDSNRRREQMQQLRERLWNQNLARAVLVAGGDHFEAWSVDNPKVRREVVTESDSEKIVAWSVGGLTSDDVLKQRNDWFDPRKRVDKVLLDNITLLIASLRGDLSMPMACELIAKVIFVAYLEDRGIVSEDYRRDRGVHDIYYLLSHLDATGIVNPFDQLRQDFNGDFLKPAFASGRDWHEISETAFIRLSAFLSRTVMRLGQRDFWRYDFGHIPIELISGIYETFLASKEDDAKRRQGAYYFILSYELIFCAERRNKETSFITK